MRKIIALLVCLVLILSGCSYDSNGNPVTTFVLQNVDGESGNITLPIEQSDVTGLVAALGGKQPTLVSGTNIKTINGDTVLGSGNLVVTGVAEIPDQTGNNTKYLYTDGSTLSWETVSFGAEVDPVFSASDVFTVTATDISYWNLAYGWGNHALAGYGTSNVTQASVDSKVDKTTTVNGQALSANISITSVDFATNSGTSTSTNQTSIAYATNAGISNYATNSGTATTANTTLISYLPTANVSGTPVVGNVLTLDANKTFDNAVSRGISYQTVSWNGTLIAENNTFHWTVPSTFNGMNIVEVAFHVYTVSSSGTPTFNLYNATQTWTILSTPITIDANEKDSKDATTSAVINTAFDAVATGDEITGGCSVAGTGTQGGEIRITLRMP